MDLLCDWIVCMNRPLGLPHVPCLFLYLSLFLLFISVSPSLSHPLLLPLSLPHPLLCVYLWVSATCLDLQGCDFLNKEGGIAALLQSRVQRASSQPVTHCLHIISIFIISPPVGCAFCQAQGKISNKHATWELTWYSNRELWHVCSFHWQQAVLQRCQGWCCMAFSFYPWDGGWCNTVIYWT